MAGEKVMGVLFIVLPFSFGVFPILPFYLALMLGGD